MKERFSVSMDDDLVKWLDSMVDEKIDGYQGCQNSDKAAIDTKRELAAIAGVSHDTIAKVKKIEEKAPEETKQKRKSYPVNSRPHRMRQIHKKRYQHLNHVVKTSPRP